MLGLYIICAVILALILLLLMPVKLKVKINRNFTYQVSVGPVSVITDKPKKEKKTNKINNKGESENYLKKLYREKGFSGTVTELFSYLKIIFSEIGYFLGKIKIRDFVCKVSVSEEDAAETAISYGIVSAAVYAFTGFLDSVTDFKYKNITVNADYSGENSLFELGFTVKIKIIFLLITAFKLLIKFVKYKREV